MKTAIIYTRFSPRPNSQECDSCEKQEKRCGAYCKHKDYCIAGTFSDKAVTGGVFERPGLGDALTFLRSWDSLNPVIVVVDSVERLARDMLVTLTIRHEVEKAGGIIEYADGTPTTTTPEGELFSNILAAFAAYERSRISYRTSRGMKRRQAEGAFFGKPPVGWMRNPDCSTKLIPCEQEQKAIARIHELQRAGHSSQFIADVLLCELGHFRGKLWSPRTIRKIITNTHPWHMYQTLEELDCLKSCQETQELDSLGE